MEFSASQIAAIVNGEIIGSSSAIVTDLAKIEEGKEGTLSFLSNPKYEEFIYTTKSSICIVNKDFIPVKPLPLSLTLIKVENSYTCFAQLLELYDNLNKKEAKIEQPSFIDNSALIGSDLYLGAFAYIGKNVEIGNKVVIYPNVYLGDNVKIGSNTVLHPGVSIYFGCKVGENCIIHAGTIVGSDGFGFAPNSEGVFQKIPQIGNVIIENNVEIGSNCAIDRATMGSTFIREGVKIDNLCQIAHNVDIGENSALAALVAVAGSAKIGKRVMIGGQAAINGHLSIADDTKIVGQSGVVKTVKEAVTLMGTPAIPLNDFKKSSVGFRKLPFILSKLEELEKKIKDLE
ncbi:MAG: UDP-3-O-(3-hydroxymyristoyl)glucosamine N-acyltransferase [Crocinitomicaceae bacterium]|nr:UDP-3-O-(3-hydroxymyristoyl)glucosamine N-acyltransferase [Crocinitomicaceae bacterium]NDC93184.1 UDP-3-O-(3-hydroxymyristoyl)glucosamine N-acyltransferase [Flavobacteriales bacterium]